MLCFDGLNAHAMLSFFVLFEIVVEMSIPNPSSSQAKEQDNDTKSLQKYLTDKCILFLWWKK